MESPRAVVRMKGGFRLVSAGGLSEQLREEALKKLYSIYARHTKPFFSFEGFKKMTEDKNNSLYCMVKNGRLVGALCFSHWGDKNLMLNELWAAPSKEFIKANGATIGKALYSFTEKLAAKENRFFCVTPFVGAGKRFEKRIEGKLPSQPRPRPKRRQTRP